MVDSLFTKLVRLLGPFQKVEWSWYPENLLVSTFVPRHKLSQEFSNMQDRRLYFAGLKFTKQECHFRVLPRNFPKFSKHLSEICFGIVFQQRCWMQAVELRLTGNFFNSLEELLFRKKQQQCALGKTTTVNLHRPFSHFKHS